MKNKKFYVKFKQSYLESWKYIKNSRNFIYSGIGIFFLFSIIGFLVPVPEQISSQFLEMIKQLLEQTSGMSQGELIWFIFWNNLRSSFFGLFFGIFFGFFSLVFAVFNGYFLGFVASFAVSEQGFFSLWRILPHGIFELPAIFISLGLGLKLGSFVFERDKLISLRNFLFESLRVFLLIIFPLLVVAAIIEGTLIFFTI
ncbi:stage II sporulation protein M [Candidatus Pacearchaeota archaeon]|nr:stage II sporulation protein M [Candidatus Pacearchaeota archaeon]